MLFQIIADKQQNINKCIRFPEKLVEQIEKITNKKGITFSKFVILACNYALANLEEQDK